MECLSTPKSSKTRKPRLRLYGDFLMDIRYWTPRFKSLQPLPSAWPASSPIFLLKQVLVTTFILLWCILNTTWISEDSFFLTTLYCIVFLIRCSFSVSISAYLFTFLSVSLSLFVGMCRWGEWVCSHLSRWAGCTLLWRSKESLLFFRYHRYFPWSRPLIGLELDEQVKLYCQRASETLLPSLPHSPALVLEMHPTMPAILNVVSWVQTQVLVKARYLSHQATSPVHFSSFAKIIFASLSQFLPDPFCFHSMPFLALFWKQRSK